MNPDYSTPPPSYQVMKLGQAKREFPEEPAFTIDGYYETWGLTDEDWCYVNWYTGLKGEPKKPLIITHSAMDYEYPGRFDTFEDACRMAWHSYMHHELLGYKTPKPEIDSNTIPLLIFFRSS